MIGLVLGIIPVPWLPALPGLNLCIGLMVIAIGVSGMLAPGILPPSARERAALVTGMALGFALASLSGHDMLDSRLATRCEGVPLSIEGEVASLPRSSRMPDDSLRQRFEFSLANVTPRSCRGPRRVLLSYYGDQRIIPGARWEFELKLKKPWGLANPGSFNMQAWFAQTGIDATGSVSAAGAHWLGAARGMTGWHHRLRQAISERISALAQPADVTGILRAVTVADKSGIDSRLWMLLQQFGINHLLVISGLHIGLVAGMGYLLGGLVTRVLQLAGRYALWLPPLLALCCAAIYALLAGFSLSTQRALCMLVAFIIAGLLGRRSTATNNLLLAAVIVLLVNPLAALGSGLWLSFASVAALLWLACWQPGWPWWQRLLVTHGFMSLVMVPLGAWWFGGSSLVAAVANLLMIPLIGLVVVPVALTAVASHYLVPPLEAPLWQLAAWPLTQLLPLAQFAANAVSLFRPLVPGLPELLLAVVAVVLLVVPASLSLRALTLLLLLPLLLPLRATTNLDPGLARVAVLDVGQGTAVVVRYGDKALLYDTGGGDPASGGMASTVILPYLRRQGVSELDTLVISHPDRDHSAGAAAILAAMPVRQFLYGGSPVVSGAGRPCSAGQAWQWSSVARLRILSPAPGASLSTNNGSCVLQLEINGYRLLLPGDIERVQELDQVRSLGQQLRSDWLLVGHHGSQTSSSRAWLKTVRPRLAVISAGYANRFGHPHPDALERLLGSGAQLYSTIDSGALVFDLEADRAAVVHRYRLEHHYFWM